MPNSMYLKTVAVVVMLCGISVAAEPNAFASGQTSAKRSTCANAKSDPQAVAIFEKTIGHYNVMKTYSDQMEATSDYSYTDSNMVISKRHNDKRIIIKMARPVFYYIAWTTQMTDTPSRTGMAVGTGKTNDLILLGKKSRSFQDIYNCLTFANGYSGYCLETVPAIFFNDTAHTFDMPIFLQLLSDEAVEGDLCHVLSGRVPNWNVTYWISKTTLLIRKREIFQKSLTVLWDPNLTESQIIKNPSVPKSQIKFKPGTYTNVTYTEIHRNIVVDAPIATEEFSIEATQPLSDPNFLPARQRK